MAQGLRVGLKWIWSYRDFVLAPLAILALYLALPSRPAELEAIRLSSVDLLSSLKSGGIMTVDSPLEIYWRDPLRPSGDRGVKVDALTLSYVYLRNKGSQPIEWADAFEHPVEFRIEVPYVILEAAVSRWDERLESMGFKTEMLGGGRSCTFSTPLVRPVDQIGLAILHTGPAESLQVVGRQKGFAPLKWTDGRSTESKAKALNGIRDASIPVLVGIWIGSSALLFVSGRSATLALWTGFALAFIACLAGALIAGWIVVWLPASTEWTLWKWLAVYLVAALATQVALISVDVLSSRTAAMRLIEIIAQERKRGASSAGW